MKANPQMIKLWSERNKCWMCKHRFKQPVILPVKQIKPGKLQPNYNTEVLFHLHDTHGQDPETVMDWIFGSIYNLELTEVGFKLPTPVKEK